MLGFEHLHKYGAAIASDPEGCIEQLRELRDMLGLTEMILWFNIGGIATEVARESMKFTMEEVIPALKRESVAVG